MNKSLKKGMRIILMLIILSLISQIVHALAMGPSKQEFVYKPSLKGYLIVQNTKDIEQRVLITKEGELSEAIHIDKALITLKPHEKKRIEYVIKPPRNKTGIVKSRILLIEMTDSGSMVNARVGVAQQIIIKYPYPDNYIDGKIAISAPSYKQPVTFSISLTNLGRNDLNTSIEFIVKGPTNQEIYRGETTSFVRKGETVIASQRWQPTNPGNYYLEVFVRYKGGVRKFERTFHVPGDELIVKNIAIKNFRLGGIARIDIDVESNTNVVLRNIFAVINITTLDGRTISTIKTTPITVKPFEKTVLQGYWDTSNVEQGNYLFNVFIDYGIDSTSKVFKAFVSLDKVSFNNLPTGRVISKSSNSLIALLIAIVIILIALNIYWLIYLKKKS